MGEGESKENNFKVMYVAKVSNGLSRVHVLRSRDDVI